MFRDMSCKVAIFLMRESLKVTVCQRQTAMLIRVLSWATVEAKVVRSLEGVKHAAARIKESILSLRLSVDCLLYGLE
jgi:hypothetical protein